jgi:hypothetical protein
MNYGLLNNKGKYITIVEEGDVKTYGTVSNKDFATKFKTTEQAEAEKKELMEAKKQAVISIKENVNSRTAMEEHTTLSYSYVGLSVVEL